MAIPKGSKFPNGRDISGAVRPATALDPISLLHAIPEFSKLSNMKLYPKGSRLLVEGLTADGVYILRSGHAKLSITSVEGKTFIVRIARPGDLLGLQATLAGSAYEGTVETLTPCQVDFISGKDLLVLLGRLKSSDLSLAIAVSRDFTEFIEQARVLLLAGSVVQRVARLLVRLGDEFGKPSRAGIRLDSLLTHEEIGQMIGSSRETVTRSLSMLKRKRIIHANKQELLIKDRAALIALR
jgi:CRP/FNR family transcriptional regulator